MKKIIAAVFLVIFSMSSGLFTQSKSGTSFFSGDHDSLLFDGADEITTVPTNRTEDCKIMVTYAYGSVEGTFYKTDIIKVCGVRDTSVRTVKGELKINNVLKLGDEITTGDNSYLELKLYDGSFIRLGPNSKITITGDMCESQTLVHMAGKMWTSVKKLLGSQKYEVKTERNGGGVRGTQFSIETTKDKEIIRVSEGEVEVKGNLKSLLKTSTDVAQEIANLNSDMSNKKITSQEYDAKMDVLSPKYEKALNDLYKNLILDARYRCSVDSKGVISDPVPIESTEAQWFDDVNFKK